MKMMFFFLFPFTPHSEQDCEIIEDGKKHVLVLYNCQLDMTGEVSFQAANAKSAANLKVKGRLCLSATLLLFSLRDFKIPI